MSVQDLTRADVDRFWSSVDVSDGCWRWKKSLAARGYGSFWSKATSKARAPRISFYLAHGHLPEVVCHTCDNPACVRPDHLYAGTAKTNVRDAVQRGRHHQVRKSECLRGHAFTPENTWRVKNGASVKRVCKTCRRERDARLKGYAPTETPR